MTSSESPLVTPPPKKEAFIKRWLKTSLFLVTCALLGKAGMMIYQSRSDGIPLAIKWEGAWLDANTRDVGASVNQCLGKPLLKEGILQRANVWFSGWSCAKVGSPDVIYSLNFDPARHERYFCMDQNAQKLGQHFGSTVLHDLEFLETWSNPAMRETACQYLRSSFQSIAEGKKSAGSL